MEQKTSVLASLGFGLVLGISFSLLVHREVQEPAQGGSDKISVSAAAPSQGRSRAAVGSANRKTASSKALTQADENSLKKIQKKYGDHLKATFSTGGRLSSIRGNFGKGRTAGRGFRSDDPQKAIARAREILDDARDLLGLNPDLPLEGAVSRGDSVSAQVFFQETHKGTAIAPFGKVTVVLGSQGELIGLDSDYVPKVNVVNTPKLSRDEALAKARATEPASEKPGYRSRVEGGHKVIWLSRSPASVTEGRHAYEYLVQGRQVVIDAANGKVIYKRDRRNF